MGFHPRRPLRIAGLALALGLGACTFHPVAPTDDPLVETNPHGLAGAVVANLRTSVPLLTEYGLGPDGPLLPNGQAPISASPGPQFSNPTSCPSFSPDPIPDADEDGVPDDTVFSFDACDHTDERGTSDWSGTVRVSDPGAQLGYDLEIDGLSVTSPPSPAGVPSTTGAAWIGSHRLRGSSSSISLGENFEFRRLFAGGVEFHYHSQWRLDFTADVPGSITFGEPLPAGHLDVHGFYNVGGWSKGVFLRVNTLVPLVWDPACGGFVSGSFETYPRLRRREGVLQVTFTACGVDPTVEVVRDRAFALDPGRRSIAR